MRDLKFIFFIVIFVILAFVAATIIVHPAKADSVSIPTNTVQAPHGQNSTIEVHQGSPNAPEIVYQEETVDLTLVEGWYGIVERVPGGELVDVSQYSHRILVSASVFPVGTYYQWSPEGINGNGNNIAFEVQSGTRPVQEVAYVKNETAGETEISSQKAIENLPLPAIHVADYLVCHGDPLNVTFNDTAQVWLFAESAGGTDWMKPRYGNMSVKFSSDEIESLTPGDYMILIQHTNQNKIADITYANFSKYRIGYGYDDVLYSPFGGDNYTITGLPPSTIRKEIMSRINAGMWISQGGSSYNVFDDTYTLQTLRIEDPYSEITMIDEYVRSEDFTNASKINIAGYTNFANNTVMEIVLDNNNQNNETIPLATQITISVGNEIGDRRQFSLLYPVFYQELAGGGKEHSFTVIGPDGSNSTSSYHVYDAPAGQPVPLQTIRYVGGNEFKPTPTPEQIIRNVTIPGPVVTQIVYKTIVQKVEVLPWWLTWPWWALWIIIAAIAIYIIWRFKP